MAKVMPIIGSELVIYPELGLVTPGIIAIFALSGVFFSRKDF